MGVMSFLRRAENLSLPRIVSIQNAYNLVNRSFETGLAEIFYREQVSLLAYSPLGQGYLTRANMRAARFLQARARRCSTAWDATKWAMALAPSQPMLPSAQTMASTLRNGARLSPLRGLSSRPPSLARRRSPS